MSKPASILLPVLGASLFLGASAAKAADPDPLTADPAAVAAQVLLPDGVALSGGGVIMQLRGLRPDTQALSEATYVLQPVDSSGVYALSPTDQARLTAQQALILGWMEAGIEVDGSFGMTIDPCLTGGTVPPIPRASINLRANVEDGFFPVVDDMRLRRMVGHPVRDLPRCDAQG